MILRPYQEKAVAAIYNYFSHYDGNPLIVLPTATGKSLVIAEFCKRSIKQWPDTRIIIATHNRDLVKSNYLELCKLWEFAPVGIYSAGLNRRQTTEQILFCGIQSAYTKAFEFQRCDILIIDEAHTISEDSDTMWQKFIADLKIINPQMKIVGLTATAFRMKSGHLTNGDNPIFTDVAYEYSIIDAIKEGYLCEIIPKHMDTVFDLDGVQKRGGEFIPGQLERAVNVDSITSAAIDEIIHYGANRKTWLLFCSGVAHSHAVAAELNRRGIECETVTGETPNNQRDDILRRFKAGELRAVTNNNVMTTGTNIPCIDLIAGLRPTGSAGLHIQMLGRGMRLHSGKENCLYLDFAKNVHRFGPLDMIRPKVPGAGGGDAPVKVCEAPVGDSRLCHSVCFAGCRICPDCGAPFPEPELKINKKGDAGAIISTQLKPEWHVVMDAHYDRHEKAGKIPSMRVSYYCHGGVFREWICFEHTGYARDKAVSWHIKRNDSAVPRNVSEALENKYPMPKRILVTKDGKFDRIISYDFTGVEKQEQQEESLPIALMAENNEIEDEIPW